MKIAFILSGASLMPTNGVISQAKTWEAGLSDLGHEVTLVDMWEVNEWGRYDIIHYFGFSIYMKDHIIGLSKINPNIVVSPILDPNYSIRTLKLYANWGSSKLGLTNRYHAFHSIKDKIKLLLARSDFEKEYLIKGFGFKETRCSVVPLSFRFTPLEALPDKEPFCLHVSLLADERKNVKRLIQAAKKYQFKLVLGGRLRNAEEEKVLKSWIGGDKNIELTGTLSDEALMNLYARAKVFALPSTNEGVGIVAIEAAAMGCEVVVTSIGGPKEYYNGMAEVINPYSIDEIGSAVSQLLYKKTYQPKLANYIMENYSLKSVSKILETEYYSIIWNTK